MSNPATQVADSIDNSQRGDQIESETEGAEYPTKWKLCLITIGLCLAVFCFAIDNTIVVTAIPRITDDFHALNDVGWYISSYFLCTAAFQLIFGKLYTFYSIKWVFLTAIFIFELGSLICGVSPNSTTLIIGRAIAGLGAAGIFSGAILIIASSVPLRQRPTYTGMLGGIYGIASVAGPVMGGAFTDSPRLTWRWCFYVNLPFGLITNLFIIFFFSPPKRAMTQKIGWKAQLDQMDLPGTALFLPGVVCLLLALSWGGTQYSWGSGRIIALFVIAAFALIGFVIVQIWQGEKATVPPRVLKNRNVFGSMIFGACLGGAFFVIMSYIPIWFQAIKGVSAVKSGIMNLPMILGFVLISMIAGILTTVFGYYTPFIYCSVVFMSIGAGLCTTLEVSSGPSQWIGYQFIFGAGIGFGMQQTLVAVQTSLPDGDIPIGTAIIMFSQTLGGAIVVSIGQNIFSNQLVRNLIKVVPDIDPKIVMAIGATQLKNAVPENLYHLVLIAYNKALTETFYTGVALAALSAVGAVWIEWKSVKGKNINTAAAV